MPIRSQRLPMRFEDWELLPYQPGWKYEYWGGCAHITPNHQTAVTVATVTPRPVTAPCVIRPARPDDATPTARRLSGGLCRQPGVLRLHGREDARRCPP